MRVLIELQCSHQLSDIMDAARAISAASMPTSDLHKSCRLALHTASCLCCFHAFLAQLASAKIL